METLDSAAILNCIALLRSQNICVCVFDWIWLQWQPTVEDVGQMSPSLRSGCVSPTSDTWFFGAGSRQHILMKPNMEVMRNLQLTYWAQSLFVPYWNIMLQRWLPVPSALSLHTIPASVRRWTRMTWSSIIKWDKSCDILIVRCRIN